MSDRFDVISDQPSPVVEGGADAMAERKVVDLRGKLPVHPVRRWKKRKKITQIVVHSTFSNNQDPYKTARYHVGPNHISKKGCAGIVYHDYISQDGTVYRCNDYADWTWHAGWINRWALGVTMAFRGLKGTIPPVLQYQAMIRHVTKLALYLGVQPKKIRGHREIPGFFKIFGKGSKKYMTTCPGLGIDLKAMRRDVTYRMQRFLKLKGLYKGKIDGKFGKLSKAALKKHHAQFAKFLKSLEKVK
jgi:hypothetical protein